MSSRTDESPFFMQREGKQTLKRCKPIHGCLTSAFMPRTFSLLLTLSSEIRKFKDVIRLKVLLIFYLIIGISDFYTIKIVKQRLMS